ncbi:YciI family protein [Sandaracinobacteroides saxicola]|uniref:YciI family protein n=1 Tax=Sandaracinobacteroides saxicola TaxID=2759707 RepID=A0A7G5IFT1_9SPHN|nr:YciI family protein [Sandaracinobacteroides saxicola]QMW22223.1 YciI family protein [Sandaracinobacteroides saxicola]
MQYALLIYENEAVYGGDDTPAMHAAMAAHGGFVAKLGEHMRGGAGLKGVATATTLRAGAPGAARTIHDGPYAEAREQLGGFYLIDVPDLDAAIRYARELPLAGAGAVEIRPLLEGQD